MRRSSSSAASPFPGRRPRGRPALRRLREPEPEPGTGTPRSGAVLLRAKASQKPKTFADLLAYELRYNPDNQRQFDEHGQPLDAIANPYYVVRSRSKGGFLLLANAGGNDIVAVSKKGTMSTYFVPPSVTTGPCATLENDLDAGPSCDAVPTGMAYGPDGTSTSRPRPDWSRARAASTWSTGTQAAQDLHRVQRPDGRRGGSRRLGLRVRAPAGAAPGRPGLERGAAGDQGREGGRRRRAGPVDGRPDRQGRPRTAAAPTPG